MAVHEVTPSRLLRGGLLALHALAVAGLQLADLGLGWRLAGAAILALSAYRVLRPAYAVRLRCDESGALSVENGGDWQKASLLADSVVLPGLSVLRVRLEGTRQTRSIVILPDSLPPDEFRRLRVWLRWKGGVGIGRN